MTFRHCHGASGFDLDAIVQGAEQKSGVQMEKQQSQGILEIEIKSEQEYARLEIAEEDRMIGSVSWKLHWHYIQAGMHCILATALAMFFLIVQGWLMHLAQKAHYTFVSIVLLIFLV